MKLTHWAMIVVLAGVVAKADPTSELVWIARVNPNMTYTHMSMLAPLSNTSVVAAWQGSSIGEGCNDQAIYLAWPSLFLQPDSNKLWLFYSESTQYDYRNDSKCGEYGHSYPGGEVRYRTSLDGGHTWSSATTILTFQDRGHIAKVTANTMLVRNGRWLLPFWQEQHTVYDIGPGCSGVLISDDQGQNWTPYGCVNRSDTWLIENTLGTINNGSILQLFRTQIGYLYASVSNDNGETWSNAQPTPLQNPDAKVCMTNLRDGRLMLAYNPSKTQRLPLDLAYTRDGVSWTHYATLESNMSTTYQYPTPVQLGNEVLTSYSADTRTGIKLAITPL
ncbi:uncharacterized protein MONBRDRAFT_23804 [Monosiga brevicollis MX1]|uniref:Sialidase domain-containing protein n=1 Tax=Monosiga brevicollis TaxID=81824 RepID=A9UUW0_MONBE|nr:uncharacterized protein MONBRDRAFT_23804 [Monosiga brevicollis MX1]EDQ90976.1 predicted protein [Monosiga brevicollis MX1]|eukprot:XP_001744273.1 hypothetical protein [Monosiga brevicollis MX1]